MQAAYGKYRTTSASSSVSPFLPRRNKPSKLALSLAAMLSLSACAGQMGTDPLTPAQQQLQNANKHFVATTAEGAVAGAVLGALLGYAVAGKNGALIGGASGAAAGTAVGYSVAQNNVTQSHTEANLQAMIKQANGDAAAYERSAQASSQIVSDLRDKIASLDHQYAAHSIFASAYQSQVASYHNSADTMRQQIAAMEKESAALRADAASSGGYDSTTLNNLAGRIDAARQSEQSSLQKVDQAMSAVPG